MFQMVHWGTAIYQLITLIFVIGLPIALIIIIAIMLIRQKDQIRKLEQRIEQLEKNRNN